MVYPDIASFLMPIFERRRQKQSTFPAFLLLLMLLIAAAFIVWKVFYTPTGISPETTLSAPPTSAVQVRLNGSGNFVENLGVDKLLEQEQIRTRKGTAMLTFFDGSEVSMDEGAQVVLERVRERDSDNSVDVLLNIESGRVWVSTPRMINPNSAITVKNQLFEAKIHGGEISFGQNKVAVASGAALVTIPGTDFESEVELGQELNLTEEMIAAVRQGTGVGPEKTLISADFQESPWFVRHTVETPPGTIVNDSLLSTDDGEAVKKETEIEEDAEDSSPKIILTAPGKSGEVVTINEPRISITGTVPPEVEKVVVNNYTLKQFKSGDTEFLYNAAVEWGTLKKGSNEYEIVALGKGGERYLADITIVYGDEVETVTTVDTEAEAETETEEDDSETDPDSDTAEDTKTVEATGELSISTPEAGTSVDDAVIEITGTAPSNAAQIVVDDYSLTAFRLGDKTWLYRMSDALGNRELGEQTVIVEALDANGKIIASEEVTFVVESAPESEATTTENEDKDESTESSNTNTPAQADGGPAPADRPDERGVTLPPGYDSSSGSSI